MAQIPRTPFKSGTFPKVAAQPTPAPTATSTALPGTHAAIDPQRTAAASQPQPPLEAALATRLAAGTRKPKKAAPTPAKAAIVSSIDYSRYDALRKGIRTPEHVALQLDLMKQHPRWRKAVEHLERLQVERQKDESFQEKFKISTGKKQGSYSARSMRQNRLTELSYFIQLEDGCFPITLVHELHHALPREVHDSELSQLPYAPIDLLSEEDAAELDFDAFYRRLLRAQYQDESISTLSELIYYRDMRDMGVPLDLLAPAEYLAFLQEGLKIYEREGIPGYLRSEIYIAPDHRKSYNYNRLRILSILAKMQPALLQDSNFQGILGEFGIQLADTPKNSNVQGKKLHDLVQKLEALVEKSKSEKKTAHRDDLLTFVTGAPEAKAFGAAVFEFFSDPQNPVRLDEKILLEKLKEIAPLFLGNQKAKVDFSEQRDLNVARVGALAELRRRFDAYHKALRDEIVARKAAHPDRKIHDIDWGNYDALVQFYRLGTLLAHSGDPQDAALGNDALEDILKIFDDAWADIDKDGKKIEINSSRQAHFAKNALALTSDELSGTTLEGRHRRFGEMIDHVCFYTDNDANSATERRIADEQHQAVWRLCYELLAQDDWSQCEGLLGKTRQSLFEWALQQKNYLHYQVAREDKPSRSSNYDDSPPHPFSYREDLTNESSARMRQRTEQDMVAWMHQVVEWTDQWSDLVYEFAFYGFQKPKSIPLNAKRLGIFQSFFRRHPVPNQFSMILGKFVLYIQGFGLEENAHTRDDPSYRDAYANIIATFEFQHRWEQIRAGRIPPTSLRWPTKNAGREGMQLPLVYWFEAGRSALPAGLGLFPNMARPRGGQGILINDSSELRTSLLKLEQAKRGFFDPADHADSLLEQLFTRNDILALSEPATYWAYAHHAIEWSKIIAARQNPEIAKFFLAQTRNFLVASLDQDETSLREDSTQKKLNNIRASVKTHITEALENAERFAELASPAPTKDRRERLKTFAQDYRSALQHQRAFFSPSIVAEQLLAVTDDATLRPQLAEIYRLAIDHVAILDPGSAALNHESSTLLRLIDRSHFTHEEKEALIAQLVEQLLPRPGSILGVSKRDYEKHLRALNRLRSSVFNEAVLGRVALYPRAEQILLERGQKLLEEIGSFPIPFEFQGEIIEVAFRLAQMLRFVRPELLKFENLAGLEKLSSEHRHQHHLGEIFPSKQVPPDINQPLLDWNTIAVRAGLPDPEAAWQKIHTGLDDLAKLGEPERRQLLDIYDAFLLQRIEAVGNPSSLLKDVKDFAVLAQKRHKELASAQFVQTKVALTLYARSLRVLSQKEKVLLENLCKIPALAWAVELAESIAEESRAWTDLEMEIWRKVLSTPTASDAVRKRELFLLVLSNEKLPLSLQREAAMGLSQGSSDQAVLESLIAQYESGGDTTRELRFYASLARYWQRVGQLPNATGLLMLQDAVAGDVEVFWQAFDRVLAKQLSQPPTREEILLVTLQHTNLADKFLHEWKDYVRAVPGRQNLLFFKQEYAQHQPKTPDQLAVFEREMKAAFRSWTEKHDHIEAIRKKLPPVFSKLTPELRFIAQRFIAHFGSDTMNSILDELRESKDKDIAVLSRFLVLAGIPKLGQQAARVLLGSISEEDRAHLTELEDRVPHSSFNTVVSFLESELKVPWQDVFLAIEPVEGASGAMGEVWRGTLKDGRRLLFKIHPEGRFQQTEAAIVALEKTLRDYEKEADRFDSPLDVAALLRQNIQEYRQQMNYAHERRNANLFREWGYSTPIFLTEFNGIALATPRLSFMEELPGKKITDKETSPEEKKKVAPHYSRQALKMLLVDRQFHDDPHPGNVLWDGNALHWLDWPIVGKLSPHDREKLAALFVALRFDDAESLVAALKNAQPKAPDDAWKAFAVDLKNNPLQPDLSFRDRLIAVLHRAGEQRIHLGAALTKAVNFLLVVQSVVMELDPERDFQKDVLDAYQQAVG